MFRVGPHIFTEYDAVRTVRDFDELWDELLDGRDPALVAHLVPPLSRQPADLEADLHAAWAALLAAGPALRAAGHAPPRAEGAVVQLNVSGGGVPKLPVDRVEVDANGVIGDVQANRIHHGMPLQALCIWSTEVIDALRAEGHPIAPGLAGENITVRGLPWADVRPGVRLLIGDVACEVSGWAVPCSKNAGWFVNREFRRMHHERGPVSRVYATVVEPTASAQGSIVVGDAAILEP
jgi:MOSC domain-containing protein YiiM